MAEACEKTGFKIHSYCLMRNHFHLVVETPNGNLMAGMRWLLSAYTLRFNPRHKRFGHVFSGRYKALIVEGSGNGYLRTVCDYVHFRAGLGGAVAAGNNADTPGDRGAAPDGQLEKLPCQVGSLEKSS